jgi:citrate synthase
MEDSEERTGCTWVSHECFHPAKCLQPTIFSYGHGVLRKSDPRFIALQEFCDTRPDLLKSPTIQLVKKVRLPADELPRISADDHCTQDL